MKRRFIIMYLLLLIMAVVEFGNTPLYIIAGIGLAYASVKFGMHLGERLYDRSKEHFKKLWERSL